MAKGISPLISTVIVIMMVVSAISMVLLIGRPTIDKATEASVVNEALLNMKSIDSAIKEVASEGVQSSRTVTFKVSDGNYKIVNDSGVLFEKELLQSVYSFNTITFDGDVKSAAGINPLGLVGFWKFDEGSGTITNDSSGKDNDGIIINFPIPTVWTSGKYDSAVGFDGGNKVNVLDSTTLNPTTSITLTAWIKINSYLTAYGCVACKWDDATARWAYFLGIQNDGTIRTDVYTTGFNSLNGGTIATNQWTYIAMTYDGKAQKLYQDGSFKISNSPSASINNASPSNTTIASNGGDSWRINGTIDNVKIYNRALSASEIRDDITADPKHYYVAIDYDRIQIVGTDTFQKGIQKLCVQKIGETGNKAVVEVTTC